MITQYIHIQRRTIKLYFMCVYKCGTFYHKTSFSKFCFYVIEKYSMFIEVSLLITFFFLLYKSEFILIVFFPYVVPPQQSSLHCAINGHNTERRLRQS